MPWQTDKRSTNDDIIFTCLYICMSTNINKRASRQRVKNNATLCAQLMNVDFNVHQLAGVK